MDISNPAFVLRDGVFQQVRRMPLSLLNEIAAYFAEDLSRESIVQVWWTREEGFRMVKPEYFEASKVHVDYRFSLAEKGYLVCMIHSHNTMNAFFSSVDDADELYVPGLFGVIGRLSEDGLMYETKFRVCDGDGGAIPVTAEELFI